MRPLRHAWVDESIHDELRALVAGPARRLHCHAELATTRRRVLTAIASMDLAHLVVVRAKAEPKKQERARRKCLEQLLYELQEPRVGQVWLEARQAAQNRRDRELVDALRAQRRLSRALHLDFAKPLKDPMLWIPDAKPAPCPAPASPTTTTILT